MKEFSHYLDEKRGLKKPVKRIIWIVIILLIGFLVIRQILKSKKIKQAMLLKQQQMEQSYAVPVKAEKIRRENLVEWLETNGDIEGIKKNFIYSDYPGKIVRLEVAEGQKVSRNQTLAWMNRDIVVKRFEDYPIKTLIDGIVGKIFLKTGETVTPATPIMTVENIQSVKAVAQIVERDIGRIKIGDRAEVKVDTYADRVFEGKVVKISPVLDPMSRAAEVTVLIPNYQYTSTPLKPGMYAAVRIQVGRLANVLTVPFSSVLSDDEGKHYIFVYRDGKAKKVVVEPGLIKYGEEGDTISARIVVNSKEIQEEDFVVYLGHQFLNDGEKIRFVYEGKQYGPKTEKKKEAASAPQKETK